MAVMPGYTVDTDYFARQLNLREIGAEGQRRLANSRVLIVGMGALGHPAAQALVLAGVNRITIIDSDIIELGNLHRQPLFTPADIGAFKVNCAARRLILQRPDVAITPLNRFFTGSCLDRELALQHDIVIDATDRFSSKYLLHDTCLALGKPLVSAAISGFIGQLHIFPFDQRRDLCLRCLYPEAPPDGSTGSCGTDGILGATAQILGNLEALIAIRLLLQLPVPTPFCTHQYDLAHGTLDHFHWSSRPGCLHESPSHIPIPTPTEAPKSPLPTINPPTRDSPSSIRDRPSEPIRDRPSSIRDRPSEPTRDSPSSIRDRPSSIRESPSEIGKWLETDAVTIIDLRPAYAIQPADRSLIPGSINIPLAHLMADTGQLDPAGEYLLVCEKGIISRNAVDFLRKRGFTAVTDLPGGLAELRNP